MKWLKTSAISALMIVLLLGVTYAGSQSQVHAKEDEQDRILKNGSFEDVSNHNNWKDNEGPKDWSLWIPSGNPQLSLDKEVCHDGEQSIRIHADETARADISQDVAVTSGTTYALTYWVKTEEVESSWGGVRVRVQYFDDKGNKVKDNQTSDNLQGTNDWDEKTMRIGIPKDVSSIKVELFYETATGTAWFDEVALKALDEKAVTDFALKEKTLILDKDESESLTPIFTPEDAEDKEIDWQSSNEEIASVDGDGLVTGVEYGSATITATTNDGGFVGESLVSVEPADGEYYETLREKWLLKLIGSTDGSLEDQDIIDSIAEIVEQVTNDEEDGYWDTMNTASDKSYLWEDLKDTSISANVTSAYERLETMAQAYQLEGSDLYQDERLKETILHGLKWLNEHRYNEDKNEYDNWWDWEIGTAKSLENTLILMYEELSAEEIEAYTAAIHHFVPDPTVRTINGVKETGANLLDKALITTLEGIINEDSRRILEGRDAMSDVFLYVNSGDGMYKDGSFIQHTNIAYTGGYGAVLLSDLASMFYVLKDSPWDVVDPNAANVYDWVENAFEPLIYKGLMMDMVNGRGMTREGSSDRAKGRSIVRSLLELAQGAPEKEALEINRMVKHWITEDTGFDDYMKELSIYDIKLVKSLLNDSGVKARANYQFNHVFSNMDRVVHHHSDYAYGISLFSKNISAFEYGNGENKKGWYTGVGMTSLYNNDLDQFADDFWPTVDAVRLPGTTTDHSTGQLVAWGSYLNTKDWVGGATLDNLYGAAGMDFSLKGVTGSPLEGKKSWFMFDDEIVALGAGIDNTNDNKTETIVENRMLNDVGDNALVVNGEAQPTDLGWDKEISKVKWAHLEGNVADSRIGYYFPNEGALDVLREARVGSWNQINDGGSKADITKNYLSLAINHGKNPSDANYAYVLLPNKNVAETEAYNDNPDVTIIENTPDVAAVEEKDLSIFAANFFNAATAGPLTVDNPASVLLQDNGDTWTLAISNPTKKEKSVTVELDEADVEVLDKDDSIEVLQTAPTIKVKVDVSNARGETHTITFTKNTLEIADMMQILNKHIADGEINETFSKDLIQRLEVIQTLLDQNAGQQAALYIDDFVNHINDAAVQAQGLISGDASTHLNEAIEKLS